MPVLFLRRTAAVLGLLLALGLLGSPSVAARMVTGAAAARADGAQPLRVGSFNVRGVHHDDNPYGAQEPWRVRRAAVIRDILRTKVAVVGVQEASQNSAYAKRLVDGDTQYEDLRNGLNQAGGHFALTNHYQYNCVDHWTTKRCHYRDRGASMSTRILYDTQRVRLLDGGSHEYQHQSGAASYRRFLVWATFEKVSGGQRFLFVTTHLGNKSTEVQRAQWRELIAEVDDLKGNLPVVVTGDFQRSKFKEPAAQMMMEMKAHGYGDVVGQRPGTAKLERPRAGKLVGAWINSMNRFRRDVSDFSFETERDWAASNNDWIFASNDLRVTKWQVVVRMNKSLRLKGTIPSDHNMVRATVLLDS